MLDDLSGGREAPRGAAAHPVQGIWVMGCGKPVLEIRDREIYVGRGCRIGGRG
jgi:hypothetical protein